MSRRSRRLVALITAIAAIGLGALLVTSSLQQSTPTGITPGETGTGGASRPRDTISLTLRDVDGRSYPIPGGRPGAIFFFESERCADCVREARLLSRVETRSKGGFQLLGVTLESSDTRGEIAAFLNAAGAPDVPVALDTRLGDIARYFDVRSLGTVIVYKPSGRIVGSLGAFTDQGTLTRALARAGVRTR